MSDLRPCPFCGGTAELEQQGTRAASCIVICVDCGVTHESGDMYEQSGKSWNQRYGVQMKPKTDELNRALEVAIRSSPAGEGSIWWAAKVLAAELHYSGERIAVLERAIKDLEKKRGNQRRQIINLIAAKKP